MDKIKVHCNLTLLMSEEEIIIFKNFLDNLNNENGFHIEENWDVGFGNDCIFYYGSDGVLQGVN